MQKKILQETIDVIGTDLNEMITYEHINRLKYLQSVIKETLRLHPTVPFIQRRLGEDLEMSSNYKN